MTISEIAIAARKLGMTYGQYVHQFQPHDLSYTKTKDNPKCEWCGAEIPESAASYKRPNIKRKYCSPECKQFASLARHNQRSNSKAKEGVNNDG